jgi:CHC2 zinc finger
MTPAPTTPTRHTAAPQARETADVQRYLRALFDRHERGALIDIRSRYRGGMRSAFFAATDTFTAARTIVREGLRSDVYVGVAARRRHAGGKEAIEEIRTLWVDLDIPDARAAVKAFPVAPAIVIASGTAGHLHVYWLLQRPVGIAAAETANRRLAATVGGCLSAVTNAATILRPPGTYSHKTTPPAPVVLERLTAQLSTLRDVTEGIAADPAAEPPRRVSAPARAAGRGPDPLRELGPAVYVTALTGQAVGRSGKVSCPFHEDRTPSFHAYERADQGWYCFGC